MRPPPTYRRGYTPTLGWASLVVLLLLVELGQQEDRICSSLKYEEREQWATCITELFKLQENGTEYPEFDISHFNQTNMDNFLVVRKEMGNINKEGKRSFAGNLICYNSSLKNFTLDLTIENSNISQSVVLENNLQLTRVHFHKSIIWAGGEIKFIVSGNKLLDKDSIDKLNAITYRTDDSYIQGEGECIIPVEDQNSFADFENCHYLKGDLVINNKTNAKSKFPSTLIDIQGCISIKSTNLTNLNFLETIQKSNCSGRHEITDNKNLCIFPEEHADWIQKFKDMNNTIKIEKNSGCKGECTWKYLHAKKDKKCLIINETVTISNTKESEDLGYLSQVEEIRGRLIIQYTELSSIDMFPNLHTVTITEKDSVIYIARNKKLISIDFPALKNITSVDSSVKVFVMNNNNPNFTVEDEQYEHFRKLTDGRMTMPLKKAPPSIIVLDAENEEKDGKSVKKLSEDEKLGIIIGISSAIVFVVILLVVVIVTFVIYYNKWKKRMEEQRRIDENERMELDIATNKTIFYYL